SLIYPALVICVGIAMIVFFLTIMLPKFMGLFGDVGVTHLPTMTVILINVSTAFKKYWWLMLLTLITAIILFKRFQATTAGRRKIDQIKMKLPIVGRVISINLY